ncbi:hypothetical protein DXM21_22970 [Agrobacterium rosae]|nr:hypothetical protein DXM21_22970 [Agrobacterium rosae]KAA3513967.1 hypothetical protein DXM25_23165 [Agrobacterium rosae]MQB50993.1 hypothetical protein [Agrobacterium rosae]
MGDRQQEIVLIGADPRNQAAIRAELDACRSSGRIGLIRSQRRKSWRYDGCKCGSGQPLVSGGLLLTIVFAIPAHALPIVEAALNARTYSASERRGLPPIWR